MVLGIVINRLAVIVAAIASMIVGSLWYGPLFGKTWMKLSEISKQKLDQMKKKAMSKTYLLAFIGSIFMAYVLAGVLGLTGVHTFGPTLLVAFWVWLGFIATETLHGVLWEGKPWGMFWLHGIGQLVNIAVMALIIASW